MGESLKPSNKFNEIYGIKTADNFVKSYFNFIDCSLFVKESDGNVVCLGKIIQDLTSKYKNSKIFISGYAFGGIIASFMRLTLINDYGVTPQSIVSYTYG